MSRAGRTGRWWSLSAGWTVSAVLTVLTLVACASGRGWVSPNGGAPGPSSSATSIGNTPSDPSTPMTSPSSRGEAPPSAQGPASSYSGSATAGGKAGAANVKSTAREDAEAGATQVQLAQPLDATRGAELFGTACVSCHTSELASGSRVSEKTWVGEVTKMRKWGALVDEEDVAPFALWLSRKYPADGAPPAAARMPASAALSTLQPQGPRNPHGEAAKGKELFAQACAACHGAGALGLGGGPELANDPVLRQQQAFAQLIRTGRGRMPGYDDFKGPDIDNLRAWLRTIR